MTLASFTVELRRTNELLDRIAAALERLAGPELLPVRPAPRQSTLSDYYRVTTDRLAHVRAMVEEFAKQEMVVPGSGAWTKRAEELERVVRELYGEEAVKELPWRVKPGVRGE